jgi:prefoldin subunit 5
MLNPNLSSLRTEAELEERCDRLERRHRIFGIASLVLVLAIIGGAYYDYLLLKRQNSTLTQLPAVQKVVETLDGQMKAADSKFDDWAKDREELRDQMAKLGQRISAAGKQAEQSSALMMRRVQEQVDTELQGLRTRLARLESSNDTEQTRVAELQRELGAVRSELQSAMSRQGNDLASLRQQMDLNGERHERELAGLRSSEMRDRGDVGAIQNKLAVERIGFEVTKNHSRALTDGILLEVTSTDVLHRRVSGWVWVTADRRTIWLRGQGAQEPVTFYGYNDGQKRELVITNVAKNSVTGYLLLPGAPASATPASTPAGE